jgi:hypothetical protein
MIQNHLLPLQKEFFEKHFNVLDYFETKEFDNDYDALIRRLEKTKKHMFDPKDRYILTFFDTSFFVDDTCVVLYNFFRIWRWMDLPFYTLIIHTNHFGLAEKIANEFREHHPADKPSVIESMINRINFDIESYQVSDPEIDKINYHALCMMAGNKRSHRYATYTNLKDLSGEKIVMSINPP